MACWHGFVWFYGKNKKALEYWDTLLDMSGRGETFEDGGGHEGAVYRPREDVHLRGRYSLWPYLHDREVISIDRGYYSLRWRVDSGWKPRLSSLKNALKKAKLDKEIKIAYDINTSDLSIDFMWDPEKLYFHWDYHLVLNFDENYCYKYKMDSKLPGISDLPYVKTYKKEELVKELQNLLHSKTTDPATLVRELDQKLREIRPPNSKILHAKLCEIKAERI